MDIGSPETTSRRPRPDVSPSKQPRSKEPKYQLWPAMQTPERTMTTPTRTPTEIERPIFTGIGLPSSPSLHQAMRIGPTSSPSPIGKTRASQKVKRRPSVTDLGPMTTVHEASQDSPTIPGRPPLHERSISAPGTAAADSIARSTLYAGKQSISRSTPWRVVNASATKRKSLLPTNLSRLIIPTTEVGLAYYDIPSLLSDSDDGDVPPRPPPKSPRFELRGSPRPRLPKPSASMSSLNSTNAPASAMEERSNSKPWATPTRGQSPAPSQYEHMEVMSAVTERTGSRPWATPTRGPTSSTHRRDRSNVSDMERSMSKPWLTPTRSQSPASMYGERLESAAMERGSSNTERGRPEMRIESSHTQKQTSAARQSSSDLPTGRKAAEVPAHLSRGEMDYLTGQARGQAEQFHVLTAKDVNGLSRELRALDERCDYLKRTLDSLRSGRRGLHQRMMAYLKSPRMAQFSLESMIKQETALVELDSSIDEWVVKLEQAENRRMRIRQKLLEHVAAALIMPTASHTTTTTPVSSTSTQSVPATLDSTTSGEYSPPMSPERPQTPIRNMRADVQSIKIYADPDVYTSHEDTDMYALLADVENAVTKFGDTGPSPRSGRDDADGWTPSSII